MKFTRLFILTCLLPLKVEAAAFCDSVIVNRAFNISSIEQQSSIYNKMRTEMCKENWSNYEEFKNKAQSAGVDVGYAGFSFGLSGAEASGSGVVQAARDKYCSMSDSEFSNDYSMRASSTVADSALLAWSQCVQGYLATVRQGLFATVADAPDYSYFDVRFDFRTPGNQRLELTALNVDSPTIEVKCKDGTVDLNPSVQDPYILQSNDSTIRCYKSKPEHIMSSINTNAGTIFSLESYSQSPSIYDREQITLSIAELNQRIASLQQTLDNTNAATLSSINNINASIGNSSLRISNNANEIENEKLGQKFIIYDEGGCPAGYTQLGYVGLIMRNTEYPNNPFGHGSALNNEWTWSHPILCSR